MTTCSNIDWSINAKMEVFNTFTRGEIELISMENFILKLSEVFKMGFEVYMNKLPCKVTGIEVLTKLVKTKVIELEMGINDRSVFYKITYTHEGISLRSMFMVPAL